MLIQFLPCKTNPATCTLLSSDTENALRHQQLIEAFTKLTASVNNMNYNMEKRMQNLEGEVKGMHQTLNIVRGEIDVLMTAILPREGLLSRSEFEFQPVSNETDLFQLNTRLGADEEFKRKVLQYLQQAISKPDVNNRLHEALDLLISRKFMPHINWSGKTHNEEKKIAFSSLSNILCVLKEVGGNQQLVVTSDYLKKFLIGKLRHAFERQNLTEERKTSCHVHKRNTM
ncbi:uncharacterized protein LOC125769422 [Anopheles funestus]|uniref:uncharacterized protein LOC125769422 n=1 Tax=Anopheles funestus TaxID=62324 RepID=UPI0020C69CDF|nr:uncharacterized protein LOC125769422 [Anopheles funestus]